MPETRGPQGPRFSWAAAPAPLLVGGLLLAALGFNLAMPGVAGVYDSHRVLQILLLGLVIAGTARLPPLRHWTIPAALASLGLLSAAFAAHRVEAVAVLLTELGLLYLAWAIARTAAGRPRQTRDLWQAIAVAAALAYAVRTAAALAAALPDGQILLREIYLGFSNTRHFAQLTPLLLPILLVTALDDRLRPLWRGMAAVAGFFWWALVWLNGSSGAFYAIWLAFGATVLLGGWRRTWRLLALNIGVFVLAVGAIRLMDAFFPFLAGLVESATLGYSGRDELWARAAELILQRPWLGWGPGQYPYVVTEGPGHPHNAVLTFALEHGLPALVLVACLIAPLFRPRRLSAALAKQDPAQGLWLLALLAASLGGLAHAQVSGVSVMPLAQLLLVATLGLFAGSLSTGDDPADRASLRMPRTLAFGYVLVYLSLCLWSLALSCHHSADATNCRESPAYWYSYPTAPTP